MNADQKERLLKLAEDNPNLVKDVVDILKADTEKSAASDAPVAVKIVKDEDDKLVITEEQKKWAIGYIAAPVIAFIIIFFGSFFIEARDLPIVGPIFMFIIFATIGISWLCAYKTGMPTIKAFCAKHFKFIKSI